MTVMAEVSDEVLGVFTAGELAAVVEAVQRRAASMSGWGPGRMFVDDYRVGDGPVVRFVWAYGADRVRVGLKERMTFLSPHVADGNHRVRPGSGQAAVPVEGAGVERLAGEFVPFGGPTAHRPGLARGHRHEDD